MPSDSVSVMHQTMGKRYNCYGQEVERRDSIGSYDAYRELQELSSMQLMRDSILRSISKNNSVQTRYGHREEMPSPSQPSIEVKFLEKRCSSFSSPKSQSGEAEPPEQTSKAESLETNESKYPPLPDFEISGSFEASGEFFKEKNDKETGEGLKSIDDAPPKPKNSGKNSLKLAIRSKSDGIFEDCSTYNISCPDASPEFKSNEIFTNSIAGSYSDVASTDLENSSETNYSFSDSELAFSRSVNSPDSPDEQTSLCDTFFTHFINNEDGQLPKSQSPQLSQANRKASTSEQQARRSSQTPKEAGAKKSEGVDDGLEFHHGRGRNSKKLRRRHRKSHSNDPFVYECPKCGVSYVIASKMANDGVCLHCDMWTSVDPEFVKREKLLTWNTCRIC